MNNARHSIESVYIRLTVSRILSRLLMCGDASASMVFRYSFSCSHSTFIRSILWYCFFFFLEYSIQCEPLVCALSILWNTKLELNRASPITALRIIFIISNSWYIFSAFSLSVNRMRAEIIRLIIMAWADISTIIIHTTTKNLHKLKHLLTIIIPWCIYQLWIR